MQVPTAAELWRCWPTSRPTSRWVSASGGPSRRGSPSWSPEYRDDHLIRWKIIASTPALRNRAAEFERTTAGIVADALPVHPGETLSPTDRVVVNAYLSAFTMGMLAWADGNGERKLEEIVDEAFDALEQP